MTAAAHERNGLCARMRDFVRRRPRLYGLVRVLKYGPFLGWRDTRTRTRLIADGRAQDHRMMNLGSGGRYEAGMVNLDVTTMTGPDVVGDGYALPFPTGAFDLVICDYVIEHVPDPHRFLGCIRDVLRPGGMAYLEVPFLQPRHGAPHDYTRWTREGFRLAASRAGFEVRGAGVHGGSAYTVFWVLKEWLALLTGLGLAPSVAVARYLWAWVLCPLLILDAVLPPVFRSETLASGFYFVLAPRRPDATGGKQ